MDAQGKIKLKTWSAAGIGELLMYLFIYFPHRAEFSSAA